MKFIPNLMTTACEGLRAGFATAKHTLHYQCAKRELYFHHERPIAFSIVPMYIRVHRDPDDFFFRATGALPGEADYLFKVGRGSHRPRWQSLASVIDDSVFPDRLAARSRDSARSLSR